MNSIKLTALLAALTLAATAPVFAANATPPKRRRW